VYELESLQIFVEGEGRERRLQENKPQGQPSHVVDSTSQRVLQK
jgi:hypothetical protein